MLCFFLPLRFKNIQNSRTVLSSVYKSSQSYLFKTHVMFTKGYSKMFLLCSQRTFVFTYKFPPNSHFVETEILIKFHFCGRFRRYKYFFQYYCKNLGSTKLYLQNACRVCTRSQVIFFRVPWTN